MLTMTSLILDNRREAVEIYGAGTYGAKLEYAEKFLSKHEIKLSSEKLKPFVDEAIKKIEQVETAMAERKEI